MIVILKGVQTHNLSIEFDNDAKFKKCLQGKPTTFNHYKGDILHVLIALLTDFFFQSGHLLHPVLNFLAKNYIW